LSSRKAERSEVYPGSTIRSFCFWAPDQVRDDTLIDLRPRSRRRDLRGDVSPDRGQSGRHI